MVSFVSHTTQDCRDAHALAEFWRQVLGYVPEPGEPYGPGEPECAIQDPETGHTLLFLEVEDFEPGKNRIHLDLRPRSGTRDAEVQRLLALGAVLHADRRGIYGPGTGWWTLADPEGNQFCVLRSEAELTAMRNDPEIPESETVEVPGWGRLRRGEYAFPGALRDTLVAAILSGRKSATATLAEECRREGAALPQVGEAEAVLDSRGRPVAVTITTDVQVLRLADVDDEHAVREGEGYPGALGWRQGHEAFWTSPEYVAALGEPPVPIDDDTEVVCVRFEVAERL